MSRTPDRSCSSAILAVQLVEGKWKMQILCTMRDGPVRLGGLVRALPLASKKVLTENLRRLQNDGLVVRRDFGGRVRRVEYDFADQLRLPIQAFLDQSARFGDSLSLQTQDLKGN